MSRGGVPRPAYGGDVPMPSGSAAIVVSIWSFVRRACGVAIPPRRPRVQSRRRFKLREEPTSLTSRERVSSRAQSSGGRAWACRSPSCRLNGRPRHRMRLWKQAATPRNADESPAPGGELNTTSGRPQGDRKSGGQPALAGRILWMPRNRVVDIREVGRAEPAVAKATVALAAVAVAASGTSAAASGRSATSGVFPARRSRPHSTA